jgi:uncharacterized protein YuzE
VGVLPNSRTAERPNRRAAGSPKAKVHSVNNVPPYDVEADVFLLVLREEPPGDAVEEPDGVILSYGADGEPVSVELLNAAARKLIPAGGVQVTLEHAGRS